MLIGVPELFTRADAAGKEGTCGERSSRWGAEALSACSARQHFAFRFLQELLHTPSANLGRTEAQGAGELGSQQLHSPWHPSP